MKIKPPYKGFRWEQAERLCKADLLFRCEIPHTVLEWIQEGRDQRSVGNTVDLIIWDANNAKERVSKHG